MRQQKRNIRQFERHLPASDGQSQIVVSPKPCGIGDEHGARDGKNSLKSVFFEIRVRFFERNARSFPVFLHLRKSIFDRRDGNLFGLRSASRRAGRASCDRETDHLFSHADPLFAPDCCGVARRKSSISDACPVIFK